MNTRNLSGLGYDYEKHGWKFGLSDFPEDEKRLKEDFGEREFLYDTCKYEYYINHVSTGIKFCFHAYDAFCKWKQEKEKGCTSVRYKLPGYCSCFIGTSGRYDSQYVGRVVIEKEGEKFQDSELEWKDIDWDAVEDQIYRTNMSAKVSDLSENGPGNSIQQAMSPEGQVVYHKQVSLYGGCLNRYPDDNSACYSLGIDVVVRESGWFVSLEQTFWGHDGFMRSREMNMHHYFKQNIIYREIFVRQRDDYVRCNLTPLEVNDLDTAPSDNLDFWTYYDGMLAAHFHEAKQLDLQEACKGGSDSSEASDSPWDHSDPVQYTSFSVGALEETSRGYRGALAVPIDKIELLVSNYGIQIKSLEDETETRI